MRFSRNYQQLLLVFIIFLTLTSVSFASDELPEGRMSVTITGGDAYIETLEGKRYGLSPFTQKFYQEITGVLKTSGDGKVMIEIPADQLYGFWLEKPDEISDPVSAEILTAEWRACINNIQNNTDTVDLLVMPESTFSKTGPIFDKVTVYGPAGEFPDFLFEFPEMAGTCRMSINSGFDMETADPAAADALAEFVITYYSKDSMVSVWAVSAAVETEELFTGSAFLFDIDLSCEDRDQTSVEKIFPQITMKQNGIFFIDLDNFRSGSAEYFEGDLNGDDIYEIEASGF